MISSTQLRACIAGVVTGRFRYGGPTLARGHARYVLLIAGLLMLFAQVVELTHSHDRLPERLASCEICLTLGSVIPPLPSHYASLPRWRDPLHFEAFPRTPVLVHEPIPRSRAPPFA